MSSSEDPAGAQDDVWLRERRLVVTGVGRDGRSNLHSDELAPAATNSAGTHVATLWQSEELPTDVSALPSADWRDSMIPPPTGVKVVAVTLPPDGSRAGFGMHRTESVDVFTVVSGEVVVVMEGEEVTLRPGDTLVQRAHQHQVSNRTSVPAVVLITLLGIA